MNYTIHQIYTGKQCKRMLKNVKNESWINAWQNPGTTVWREDLISSYHDTDLFFARKYLPSTVESPVDWIFEPWQLSCLNCGAVHDWHRDNNGERDHRKSSRSRSLIIALKTDGAPVIETETSSITLQTGEGVVLDAKELYRLYAPQNEKRFLLTIWGMRYNTKPN